MSPSVSESTSALTVVRAHSAPEAKSGAVPTNAEPVRGETENLKEPADFVSPEIGIGGPGVDNISHQRWRCHRVDGARPAQVPWQPSEVISEHQFFLFGSI